MIDPNGFQPLPLHDDQAVANRAEAEALLAQANRMHGEAKAKAEKTIAAAQTEAERIVAEGRSLNARALAGASTEANGIRDKAQKEAEQRKQTDDKFDTWSARFVILGAVGLTASSEYELAKMVGFEPAVAWLLPFVIDIYVIQAFRRHRDIVQAITLTIAANVTYHLADEGLFGVSVSRGEHHPKWWLIALVASVASLILWRMHLITAPPKQPREGRRRRQKQRQQAPAVATVSAPEAPPTPAVATANSDRQEAPIGGANRPPETPAKKPAPVAKKPAQQPRQKPANGSAKKTASKRRSLDEWVTDAGPVFHAEFARLRRNPTASEFATAIDKAGLGKVSDSTAKNIRAEILDRAPLPELDDAE
ncbi:hypothetical protein ABZT43_12295 [Streptomyces sp. NPDC005349]|uniref:hypothetical protein n=1 Tax=Streptomyces sp. NPDC005349 TaxID=3157037 RepID=UPI0033A3B1DD